MNRTVRSALATLGALALVVGCTNSEDSPSAESTSAATTAPSEPPAAPTPTPDVAQATPVLASVIASPIPVPATDGKVHLAYELQVINSQSDDVTLKSLSVKSAGKDLLTLAGDQLAYWMRPLGATAPSTTLSAGRAGLVWIDLALDAGTAVPTELSHDIVVDLTKPAPPLLPATMVQDDVARVTVSTHQPAVIASPLEGPKWLDANSCCDMTPHRMAVNPLNGQQWAAERFAIDYVQIQDDGTLFTGDVAKLENYPYFGADIHAVADGPVVAVVDGLPEQVAGKTPSGLPLDQYGGNHVVQDVGGGNYAFYAHLKTGSVKVQPGDQLSTGQVIANLGNTGNTDAPHLHFHVMSSPDPLRSNGLPFVIKNFTLTGRLSSTAELDALTAGRPGKLQPGFAARDEADVSPLVFDVMTYANQ